MFLNNHKRLFALALCVLIAVLSVFSQPVHALGNVRVVSHSSFYDSLNDLLVVGEVENVGDMATRFTKVTATFYNSLNQIVTSDYGYSSLDVLLAGRKSPFTISLLPSQGSLNVYNYTLSVSWTDYPLGKALGLVVLSSSDHIDGYGYKHVTGQIQNQGTTNANFTEAIATFYDSTGKVVGTDWDYTEPLHLTPNQISTFDIELIYTQQVMKVASFSLTAESSAYAFSSTPIPTPSPTPTASPTPTPTLSPTPSPTPTATPTPAPTPTPTPTPTAIPTPSDIPTPAIPTPTPTPKASPSPTTTATQAPTATPYSSQNPTPTPTVPEFPLLIILPIFIIASLLSIVFIKRRIAKK